MKTTVKVSLNSIAFNLEEDAYLLLDEYIISLTGYFQNKEDGIETISDIEARIAELLQIRVNHSSRVITALDIQEIIKIMGKPNDFYEKQEDEVISEISYKSDRSIPKFSKKLYRDKDHSIIGGVCAGFGHYFSFDPVFLRIGFVAAFLFSLFPYERHPYFLWVLGLYLILWIVIPKARNLNQKLAMRGTDPSIGNIQHEGVRPIIRPRSNTLLNIIKIVAGIILGLVSLSILILIIAGLAVSFGFLQYFDIPSVWEVLSIVGLDSVGVKISFLLCLLLPLIGCLYLCGKLLFQLSFKKVDLLISIIAFLILIGSTAYLVGNVMGVVKSYNTSEVVVEYIYFDTNSEDIYINMAEMYIDAKPLGGEFFYMKEKRGRNSFFMAPYVTIKKDSMIENHKIEIQKKGWADTSKAARSKAMKMDFKIDIQDSLVAIFPELYNKSNKFSPIGNHIIITVPENKNVIVGEGIKEIWFYD